MKLVMTLLVRDEIDIVRSNIEFHLDQGVDFIVATDNLSKDGTTDVLREYERAGVLEYIFAPEDDYRQSAWVTHMARHAFNHHGADWIINNDADEFWLSDRGSLKERLSALAPGDTTVIAQRYNFLPRFEEMELSAEQRPPFYRSMIYRSNKPVLPKVAHRANGRVVVRQGNHDVGAMVKQPASDHGIDIMHFPLRSYAQFANKIIKGGAAYERNPAFVGKKAGMTWRRPYKSYLRKGNLHTEYAAQALHAEQIAPGLADGSLSEDHRIETALQRLLSKQG